MLKLSVILITLTITNFISFAQEIENEVKIKEFLGIQRFDNTLQKNPGLIAYLDTRIERGYAIEELNSNKKNDFIEISSITYNREEKGEHISTEEFLEHTKLQDFNILFYEFPMPDNEQNGYFLLDGTDKVISIYSNEHINKIITE